MAIIPKFVSSEVFYLHNPLHRNNTTGKSQWRISNDAELQSFKTALDQTWLLSDVGWGLHLENNKPANLGVAQDHKTLVFIAKFVNDRKIWHGYPADHQSNNQDIPADQILRKWLEAKVLPLAKIRKLGKGQPCSL